MFKRSGADGVLVGRGAAGEAASPVPAAATPAPAPATAPASPGRERSPRPSGRAESTEGASGRDAALLPGASSVDAPLSLVGTMDSVFSSASVTSAALVARGASIVAEGASVTLPPTLTADAGIGMGTLPTLPAASMASASALLPPEMDTGDAEASEADASRAPSARIPLLARAIGDAWRPLSVVHAHGLRFGGGAHGHAVPPAAAPDVKKKEEGAGASGAAAAGDVAAAAAAAAAVAAPPALSARRASLEAALAGHPSVAMMASAEAAREAAIAATAAHIAAVESRDGGGGDGGGGDAAHASPRSGGAGFKGFRVTTLTLIRSIELVAIASGGEDGTIRLWTLDGFPLGALPVATGRRVRATARAQAATTGLGAGHGWTAALALDARRAILSKVARALLARMDADAAHAENVRSALAAGGEARGALDYADVKA
jgi:hypothetical protein